MRNRAIALQPMKHIVGACAVSLALTAAASAQTPAGGEFRVNTYTTGTQFFARPAMEPDGDFVVVWAGDDEDGSDYGVFGQRFAASGAPRGGEFRVNTYTTGFQGRPAVAVGSLGDFVVVWDSARTDGSSILGRRYDASGDAIGGEFLVTSTTGYRPRVGRASDGRFVVSWTSLGGNGDGSRRGIFARRFDASGNPAGSDFVVNTYTTGYQILGDLAVDANGNFVVVWQDYLGNRDGESSAIFGQRYDASGNGLGSEFQVNSYTTGGQGVPSISMSAVGGFVVAWHFSSGDGSGLGVSARRFDASGSASGSDFVVSTYTTGRQFRAQVAHDTSGNFVITWQGYGDGSSDGAFAQRFSASGVRRGAEFRVNTYTTGDQSRASVASDDAGNFVVVWDSVGQDGSGTEIFAQRYGDLVFADGFDPGQ